jgi:non-specific serine/threonine protein kinase
MSNEGFAATTLLLAAARRLRPDFVLLPGEMDSLGQICRVVEGMLLALELAAAWVDTLSLSGIAAELQGSLDLLASDLVDLPERHRSIRTTFDATWRRLEPAEQEAFMRLSFFRGGLTRAAARQVAGATLSMLAQLIGKSLLQFQPALERYQLHEVLRQYGQEKLAATEALDAVKHQHFEYYLTLAETAAGRLFGNEQIIWLERLETEHDNLRAALTWGLAQSVLTEAVARLVIALAWFWRIRSHVLEGLIWLEQAIRLPGLTTATRAGVLYHAGYLAWMQDDFAGAQARTQESLRLWQSLGPAGRRGAGYASHTLGMAFYGAGRSDGGAVLFPGQRGFVCGSWGRVGRGFCSTVAGICPHSPGRPCRRTGRGRGESGRLPADRQRLGAGLTLGALANLKLQAGDLAAARDLAEEAQALRRQIGHRHSLGVILELLARIVRKENKPAEAAVFYQEAILVFDSMGNQPSAAQMRAALAALTTV